MKTRLKTTRRAKTSGIDLSRRTYVPLLSKPSRNMCFSPTSHLLALSTPGKHYKFSGFTKTVWFEHENTFQNYQASHRLRIPSRTNLRRYISTIHDFPPSKRYTSIVWSRENDWFWPYMAILRKTTYLDDHLQNVQVRFRPKIFIIYHDCTRNERYPSVRNPIQPQTIISQFVRSKTTKFSQTGVTIVKRRIHHSFLRFLASSSS